MAVDELCADTGDGHVCEMSEHLSFVPARAYRRRRTQFDDPPSRSPDRASASGADHEEAEPPTTPGFIGEFVIRQRPKTSEERLAASETAVSPAGRDVGALQATDGAARWPLG